MPAALGMFGTLKDVPKKDLISPEQALYNLLKVYFDGTAVAPSFGGTVGDTPLNYLQIYAGDFLYAKAHLRTPQQVVEMGGASGSVSAQELLNQASERVFEIAEPAASRR